jgi:hypothetical protein
VQAGAVVREAWRLYVAHWRHLVVLALAVYVLISLLVLALALLIGPFAAFVSLAGVFWLQGVLVKAVEDIRDGRPDLSLRETVAAALPRLNQLTAAGLLASFAIGIGLLLLVIPGLILLTIWSLIVPAIVLERAGVFDSFARSRALVRGETWAVFSVVAMSMLLLVLGSFALGAAFSPIDPEWLEVIVLDLVSNSLFAPFAALAWTVMYFELRRLKEDR